MKENTEAEAIKAEHRLKLMLDAAPLGCLLIDENLKVIDCNHKLLEIFNIPFKKTLLDDFFRFSPELQADGQPSRIKAVEYINKTYKSNTVVFQWMHLDFHGEPVPSEVTLARIKHEDDSAFVCYIRDLREYNKMIAEKNEADERMQFMFNSMPLTANIFNRDLQVVDCNQDCIKLFGVSGKEEYIERFYDLAPQYQLNGMLSKEMSRYAITQAFEKGYYRTEFIHQNVAGELIPCDVILIRMNRKDELCVLGYAWDLRELKRLAQNEEETRSMLDKSMAILENVETLISITDFDYNLIYMNQYMADAYGVNKDECIGRKCYASIKNKDKPCSVCEMQRMLPNKDELPTHFDDYLWDEDLGMWTENKTSIIRWVDDSLVYFHSISDRSLKKAYEDEMRKAMDASIAASASKTTFLANMSHEIRTPMNSIIGFAELALDSDITPKTEGYLKKIMDSAKWLLHIINDILDISKIESGKMELENIPFDLHGIISRCQSVILPSTNEKNLELQVSFEPAPGKNLLGDPVRLYQILINLLSNAVKFTNEGTIRLTSAIKSSGDNTATVYFEIRDSGIGMTDDQISVIFEPFIQADSSTTRIFGGTGLGLPITRNLVEMMGGKLTVESLLGAGSIFSFTITFNTIDIPADTLEFNEISIVKKPRFDGLILVCEDNPMNQQVICEHLTRVGLKSAIAENGKIGVEMVLERKQKGQKPYDLIFMDMFMPVMNGTEAASKIAALNTGSPIVAMTANIMPNELDTYKKNGMSDYVGKPFTSQELWHCLLKYLAPVSVSAVESNDRAQEDDLQKKLKLNFAKSNMHKYDEISGAIEVNDLSRAHRLAHTLKTNAGLIGKSGLQHAAAAAEALLRDATVPNRIQMQALELELNAVMEELKPLLVKPVEQAARGPIIIEQVQELYTKLESMLKSRNPECLSLLDDIRSLPGTELLVKQIEQYDFRLAAQTLSEMTKDWK